MPLHTNQPFQPNHNYLNPLPEVIKIILAEYEKADEKRRAELRQRNPDVDFSKIPPLARTN